VRKTVVIVSAALTALGLVLTTVFAGSSYLPIGSMGMRFNAAMTPFEVSPPVYSNAAGYLALSIGRVRGEDGNYSYWAYYTMDWMRLSSPPTRIYLAVGKPGQTGPVIVWLCGGGDKPSCPNATWGSITYQHIPPLYLRAEEIQPVQGVEAGDFEGFLTLLYRGAIYVQIDTVKFPNGELRAQLTHP